MMFNRPAWDFRTFSFRADLRRTDKTLASIFNATNPNLSAFDAGGGKLILYHNWADGAISPLNTVSYYESTVAAGSQRTKNFLRLYMVPGMQHCDLGPGPDSFGVEPTANEDPRKSIFASLMLWVENGIVPQAIIAAKYVDPLNPKSDVEMTRPVCPYPQARNTREQAMSTMPQTSYARWSDHGLARAVHEQLKTPAYLPGSAAAANQMYP